MTRTKRAVMALLLVAAVSALAACGSDSETTSGTTSAPTETAAAGTTETAPQPQTLIVVRGEEPVGGIKKIEVKKGDPVTFTVQSDSAQEIHVHGYDLEKEVPANGTVTFSFKASIDGAFEIELEDPGVQIASLQVSP
jgi:ABC-type Fe3+-hydroxamate transport system substrate-binding protein